MPMFEPRDVAPPRSYSPMPNIYNSPRLSQVDLANGGVVNMFRAMMAYGGLTNTVPPVRGPSSQGVESLFTRRYN